MLQAILRIIIIYIPALLMWIAIIAGVLGYEL
ncbi:Uncharacterised protein [Moraxella lacunata]|uniref:Uncharacterized protein n=1 Tax=Moraxella lacunata TaxID=477 RepID=A0A378T5I6_MORLA|nr:Uncharacterised protein [Moraxella lacunata]STZ55677.1 Uncharacterised protein [Moraxella lacunata]